MNARYVVALSAFVLVCFFALIADGLIPRRVAPVGTPAPPADVSKFRRECTCGGPCRPDCPCGCVSPQPLAN